MNFSIGPKNKYMQGLVWQEDFVDSFFRGNGIRNTFQFPTVNIYLHERGAHLTALLPGYSIEDLDITISENRLTLKGVQKTEKEEGNWEIHREELITSDFSRTFELPFHPDSEKVEAHLKNGVLTMDIPKMSSEFPKKIQIKL